MAGQALSVAGAQQCPAHNYIKEVQQWFPGAADSDDALPPSKVNAKQFVLFDVNAQWFDKRSLLLVPSNVLHTTVSKRFDSGCLGSRQ